MYRVRIYEGTELFIMFDDFRTQGEAEEFISKINRHWPSDVCKLDFLPV